MIKVSVMYPDQAEARFDIDYYIHKHIPFIREKMGASCLAVTLDKGVSGRPGTPAPYLVVCTIFSASMEEFLAGFGPVVAELDDDVPNFTELRSSVQISEVIYRTSELNSIRP